MENIFVKWSGCGSFEIFFGDVNIAFDPYLFGQRFKKLFVSPGCLHPVGSIEKSYGDAAFERDLPITKHISKDKTQVIYPKFFNDRIGEEKVFSPSEFDLGCLKIETIESGENHCPGVPTCGYMVTHKEKGISFLHIGDLHKTYPDLKELRGKIYYLIHMKLGLTEWKGKDKSVEFLKLLDFIQPNCLIPIHYRTDRVSERIPEGNWPPNVTDVASYIE